MSRILSVDLDGTLLNDEKKITPLTAETLDLLTDKGHFLLVNTGRPLSNVRMLMKELPFPKKNVSFSTFNGGILYDSIADKIIYRCTIPNDITVQVLDICRDRGVQGLAFTEEGPIGYGESDASRFYEERIRSPYHPVEDIAAALTVPTSKLIAVEIYDGDKLVQLRKVLEETFGGRLQLIRSTPEYLEVIPIEAGKDKSLLRFCEIKGVDPKDTMAAGDEQNDITMLKAAGVSVCMRNGSGEVKAMADIVTENDNNHDGLVPYIKKFFDL